VNSGFVCPGFVGVSVETPQNNYLLICSMKKMFSKIFRNFTLRRVMALILMPYLLMPPGIPNTPVVFPA
jgi:hypothetical protein